MIAKAPRLLTWHKIPAFYFLSFFFLIFSFVPLYSQISDDEIILPADVYLIPQTVYVGDRGRLVVILGPVFNDAPAFVLQNRDEMPKIKDLEINRMELEKRSTGIRLLIDFVSFAPGNIKLPVLEIPSSGSVPFELDGIEFNVASILTPDIMSLSGPALPLTVPGTGLLVYGGIGILFFILVIGAAGIFWSRRFLVPFRKMLKKKKFLLSLEQKIKLLRAGDYQNDAARLNELFTLLALEFREFLSFITGIDCRVLTPFEFTMLPADFAGLPESGGLCAFFRRWDNLRFSGNPAGRADVSGICDELSDFFISMNNNSMNNKQHEQGGIK
ncbi:MAG: hypothetical protein FWD78_14680 [Treponema sp.]|nr:hypothetical protein [Treponema sp.]